MFVDAIEALLTQHCPSAAVRAIENGGNPHALVAAIQKGGFLELMTPEDAGGAGMGWHELFDVVTLCGAWAVPLPLAASFAARALVSMPGALPPGMLTFAPSLVRSAAGELSAAMVPAAGTSSHVVAVMDDTLVLLPMDTARNEPCGVHGSHVMSLFWQAGAAERLTGRVNASQFCAIGALLHAGLIAGAARRAFALTLEHANGRAQFGKSIGKFQAVQHQLAVMAQQVAAASMAAQAGFACAPGELPHTAACAVAKARASEAAQTVAAIAHAVHGAIGMTQEYDLQLYTRRLHEWRLAHGPQAYWHRYLGQLMLDSNAPLAVDFIRSLHGEPAA